MRTTSTLQPNDPMPQPTSRIGNPIAATSRAMSSPARHGFTLVELLVVIAIIGILMGIAIPAINAGMKTAKTGYLRSECANFEQAIEAYKAKYGDYPPDFSSWDIVNRHYRKVFPEILDSELTLLFRLCDDELDDATTQTDTTPGTYVPAIMDRGEALVWAIGGFSSDAQRPFTGNGGPLSVLPGATLNPTNPNPAVVQYNVDRTNAFMELDASGLTLKSPDGSTGMSYTNRAESNDEELLTGGNFSAIQKRNDVFPVFRYREGPSPYVYFDARTYRFSGTDVVIDNGATQFNGYANYTGDGYSVVRPIISNQVNANLATGTAYGTAAAALQAWKFVNENSFQILSPGLDGVYGTIGDNNGGDPSDTMGLPFYWQYPEGNVIVPDGTATTPQGLVNTSVNKYNISSLGSVPGLETTEAFEKDNVASFSAKSFEDDLP